MADNDPFASIVDDCRYSSSQEEVLRHSKFAREDEVFDDDRGERPAPVNSGHSPAEFSAGDSAGGSNQVESTDSSGKKDLGFPEEATSSGIELAFDGEVRVAEVSEAELGMDNLSLGENPEEGSPIESPRKKSRVSASKSKGEKIPPLVQCGQKLVMDSEDRNKQVFVCYGGLKFGMVRPLRWFAPAGVEWTGRLAIQDEHDADKDKTRVAKSNEFKDNTEAIDAEEVETDEPRKNKEVSGDIIGKGDANGKVAENPNQGSKSSEMGDMIGKGDGNGKGVESPNDGSKSTEMGDIIGKVYAKRNGVKNPYDGSKSSEKDDIIGKGDAKGKGVENPNDGSKSSEKIKDRGKRVLPSWQYWGFDVDESDEMRDGASRTHGGENAGRIVVENEGQKSKTDHCGTHKDGSVNEVKNQGNSVLPPSLIEQTQGLNVGKSGGSKNRGSGSRNKQTDKRKAAENRGQKSKTEDENLKRLLDVLKMLAARSPPDDDDGEVNIIETAKKKGMTFPRNRYLVDSEKDK